MGTIVSIAIWLGSMYGIFVALTYASTIFGFDPGWCILPAIVLGTAVPLVRAFILTKSNREKQIADFKSKGFEPTIYQQMMNGDAFVADVNKQKIMVLRSKASNTKLFDFSDVRSVQLEETRGKGGNRYYLRITTKDVNDPLHSLSCGTHGIALNVYAKIEAAGIV